MAPALTISKQVIRMKLKRAFGLVFLLALFFALWVNAMDAEAAAALPGQVLRLRVVARSDGEADQADKLLVRDTVLAELSPRLEGCADLREAEARTEAALPALAAAAGEALRKAGRSVPLTLRLGRETCPLRAYETFALPAGAYESLTVTLGEGCGKNWWCVVFPPLCLGAAGDGSSGESLSVFSPEEAKLITAGDRVIRFRALELWEKLQAAFSQGKGNR